MQSELKIKKSRVLRPLLTFFSFSALFLFWEWISSSGIYRPHLFPAPSIALQALWEMAQSGELWIDLRDSAQRWGGGYILGCSLGILFALSTGHNFFLKSIFSPVFNALSSIPKVVLIPLTILWFGIGEWQKILLVAWGAFFPIWINLEEGLEQRAQEYHWVADSLGLHGFSRLRHLIFPQTLPFLITGMRIGVSTATFALAAAEMAGAFTGLAHRVFYAHEMFQTDRMMAGIIVISFLSWILNVGFQLLFNILTPWTRKTETSR